MLDENCLSDELVESPDRAPGPERGPGPWGWDDDLGEWITFADAVELRAQCEAGERRDERRRALRDIRGALTRRDYECGRGGERARVSGAELRRLRELAGLGLGKLAAAVVASREVSPGSVKVAVLRVERGEAATMPRAPFAAVVLVLADRLAAVAPDALDDLGRLAAG